MDLETILISAVVGITTSAITSYFTTRLKIREEEAKWRREFAANFAQAQATDDLRAQKMATQFAIGVLIKNPESAERERIFLPPHCRLIAGRALDNSIPIPEDTFVARQHCAFNADLKDVYIEELGSPNGSMLNGIRLDGRKKLETGDVVLMGKTTFTFHRLAAL